MKKCHNIKENLLKWTIFKKKYIQLPFKKKIIDNLVPTNIIFDRNMWIFQKRLVLSIGNYTQNMPKILALNPIISKFITVSGRTDSGENILV